ncbi:MAG: hydrogenase maturation protein [Sedimenticola sp.]
MKILFLTHAFNSLTQRLFVELRERNHEVSVEFDINDTVAKEAVALYQPDLIIAPFLKRAIPESIWSNHICLVVHPGIIGDRGPSALDWAVLNNESTWGVTVLQANAEMDGGDIWASAEFPVRSATKAGLYRHEVTAAAVTAVLTAVERFEQGDYTPQPLDKTDPLLWGEQRPLMKQDDRRINWQRDDTETVLRKIRCADGFPGVRGKLFDRDLFLYDAKAEGKLGGKPGRVIARCGPAICRATVDGAVWIGHLRDKKGGHPFKLPATQLLAEEVAALTEVSADETSGYREIWYEEEGEVGYLHFPFYNGAMGSDQCAALLTAYRQAKEQKTRIIVLMGGPDFWCNGMHLNLIEAAESPADESWRNINAIDDLAREIINTDTHITIAALQGNAGAGGVFLARACGRVWAREGIILNPHYKDMGNLYGSEYWSYLLPRYAGKENAYLISQARLPMGTGEARILGLVDEVFHAESQHFIDLIRERAGEWAGSSEFQQQLQKKNEWCRNDEALKQLESYREEELENMYRNFYGFDPSYHIARYNFVYKTSKSRTPLTIALHRRRSEITRRES